MSRVTVGRVRGHRGNAGEITVDINAADAELWTELTEFHVGETPFAVESSRSYGDKLVLKLAGLEDASAAAALKGQSVSVAREQIELDDDQWLNDDLTGVAVFEAGERLGEVRAVLPTAGADLLEVAREQGEPLLIPLVEAIVLEIDLEAGRIEVRLPEGLRELNR